MEFGYVRVSTPRQNPERQKRNILSEYPNAVMFEDTYTGTTMERPQWEKLMKKVRPGDVIVFDSVSRMSRNAEDGYKTYQELFQKGVNLVFIKEPMINTTVYRENLTKTLPRTDTATDFIIEGIERFMQALAEEQIRIAFEQSQSEVYQLRQRTKEGMLTKKEHGVHIGRPKGSKRESDKAIRCKKAILSMSKDFGGDRSDKEIAEIVDVSLNSFYKYKKELKESWQKEKHEKKKMH